MAQTDQELLRSRQMLDQIQKQHHVEVEDRERQALLFEIERNEGADMTGQWCDHVHPGNLGPQLAACRRHEAGTAADVENPLRATARHLL